MRATDSNRYQIRYYDSIKATKVSWLWYPYIPYGKITIVQGDPGEGKTTLVLHLAAALTRGEMIGTEDKQEPVTVIYQTAEDGLADTKQRRGTGASLRGLSDSAGRILERTCERKS